MVLSFDGYIAAIQNYVTSSKEIIQSLEYIRRFVEDSKRGSNIVKTVGTTSGAAATVATLGLLFAPLTGGLSVVASGVAIGGAIGSAGVAIICTIGDSSDGKKAIAKIEKCQKDHEASVTRLQRETGQMLDIVNQLLERGIDFNAAVISTFAVLTDIGKSGGALFDTLAAVNSIEKALQAGQIQKILAPTGIQITKNLQGGMCVTFPSIKAMEAMTDAEIKAFTSLSQHGPEVLLGKTLTKVGKVVAIVSIFFTIADVISLVNSWRSKHPLVEPVNTFINHLKASVESCENQITALKAFRNAGEPLQRQSQCDIS